jgi:NAD(P)-dependent dehydrogenase (short-subunit alcohol dehydrogenase family)
MNNRFTLLVGLGLSIPLLFKARGLVRRLRRSAQLPHNYERVLILGASSGIGRSIAHMYAARGARVCIVARRDDQLQEVMDECQQLSAKAGHAEYQAGGRRIVSVVADFTNVEEMVSVRTELENGACFSWLLVTASSNADICFYRVAGSGYPHRLCRRERAAAIAIRCGARAPG